jgi:hypothetical protein
MQFHYGDNMPVCHCHSFDSLEAQTAPIMSHADISDFVTMSALEFVSVATRRTEAERQLAHERIMKLQEDFLRVIAERLQVYKRYLRSEWQSSERQRQKFE